MSNPQIQNDSIIDLPNLYINGLIVNNGLTNTTLLVSSGHCRDSTDNVDICLGVPNANGQVVSAPLTINGAINGVNGLDTGTLQNSLMYQIFMIADSRGYQPTGAILTLASNAVPLMPEGYDSLRLIGYMPTNGSAQFQYCITSGSSNTRLFNYATVPIIVNDGSSTSFVNYTTPFLPPLLDKVPVTLYVSYAAAAAGNSVSLASPSFQILGFQAPVAGSVAVLQFEASGVAVGPQPTPPSLSYQVSAGAVSIYLINFTFYV